MTDDVGTTARGRLSRRDRLSVWEAHGGVCVLCGNKINPTDKWVVEHIRALALGGLDTKDNMGPAHHFCAAEKTAGNSGDIAKIAKAKRRKARHLGIRKPRTITRWRKFNGEIVIAQRER